MAWNVQRQSRTFIPVPLSMYIGFAILLRGYASGSFVGQAPRSSTAVSLRTKAHTADPKQVTEEERPNYHSSSPLENLAGTYYMPETWFSPSVSNGVSDSESLQNAAQTALRYKKGKVYNHGSKALPRRDTGIKPTGPSNAKPPQHYNFFRLIG